MRGTPHWLFGAGLMSGTLELKVIGKVEMKRGGSILPMIRSRKTRCLLAYLAMTQRVHAREDLCDLLFEQTDDPRGALRWSLSRLRSILGPDSARLIVRKNMVEFDTETMNVDVVEIRRLHDTAKTDVSELMQTAERIPRAPLAHLALPHAHDFNDWADAEQRQLEQLRSRIIAQLLANPDINPEIELKLLRLQVRFDPKSQDAAYALWRRLTELNRTEEAATIEAEYCTATGTNKGILSRKDGCPALKVPGREQNVDFCNSPDGVRIAFATVGSGPPIVKAANWLNHLELDWQSPIWGDTFQALSEANTFIRYDERGNGLSDWDVADISFEAFVNDLETVVDHLGLGRFPLLGMSQGCAVSIAYAVRHPERVSALILVGGYAAGWRVAMSPAETEEREAVVTLTRHGWGTSNPAYRQIFSQTFMPNADAKRLAWFNEFQRRTTSADNDVRFQQAFGDIDVRDILHKVRAPTLVLHATEDQRIPLHHGQELAERIPNARLVPLDSCNHIILGDEPAWNILLQEIHGFLKQH